MSVRIVGNNSFEDIPLIDSTGNLAAEALDHCHPFLQGLAAVGLSALQHGFAQSPAAGDLNSLEFGDLFNDSGEFLATDLAQTVRRGDGAQPEYANHFDAGMYIIESALITAILFKDKAIHPDYAGRNIGTGLIQRHVQAPIRPEKTPAATRLMNSPSLVTSIQAKMFAESPNPRYAPTDLDFAVSFYGGSMATTLKGVVNHAEQTVQAETISASREGDFVRIDRSNSDFARLRDFANVVRHIIM